MAQEPDVVRSVDPVSAVMSDPRFDREVATLAAETRRPEDEIRRDAKAALEEMTASQSAQAASAWDRFGRWLTRAYTIDVDASRLPELRELSPRHSLVFLPNHRSYLDPLVLRRVLRDHGLPPNFILGGANLALWPISEVAQRAGIVFIRRSTRDDPVYPEMMRLLLGTLLRSHDNLEWYFEGGRTRTGKLRPPKMGVLRYLVDAFTSNGPDADDVLIVPVSIVYDQQAEVGAISAEEGGGQKKPESVSWIVSFARAQSTRRGAAHVRFGEPLSLRSAITDARDRAGSDDPTTVVPRVAFEIANRINDATPITPVALVTFSLLDNEGRALTVAEGEQVLQPLLAYVTRRSLPLTGDADLARPEGLLKALRSLVDEGIVEEYSGGLEPVFAIADDRQHEAGFYRNTIVHWFVNRAILEVALVRTADIGADDVMTATWEGALALRDLLKYEFFFPSKAAFAAQLREEIDLVAPGWEQAGATAKSIRREVAATGLLLAHRVIGPILEAYLVAADRLADADPGAPVDRDALVAECLGVARQRWLQRELFSPESISKDLMTNALTLAGNRGLLDPGGEEVRQERRAFAEEVRDAVRRADGLRQLQLDRMQEDDRGRY